ncbi:MAG: rRNA maturation RNase YbeY [Flavobacteriia bacterium]|jgi:rRNA maturation RNase YbeY|nr:rRNA maturation RNase YbeY [Flavobacteriia bacterium]NBY41240.1 rRNA maturation RNase YbeY [Flavobacteriia bacterium]
MIDFTYFNPEKEAETNLFLVKTIPSLLAEENKEEGEISLVFCTDEELLQVNKDHLNHDFYTDIITFDYCEGNTISGDLFISTERVAANATEFGVDFEEELARVVFHGLLHLSGYNDKSEEDKAIMRSKENHYLNKLFHVKQA